MIKLCYAVMDTPSEYATRFAASIKRWLSLLLSTNSAACFALSDDCRDRFARVAMLSEYCVKAPMQGPALVCNATLL